MRDDPSAAARLDRADERIQEHLVNFEAGLGAGEAAPVPPSRRRRMRRVEPLSRPSKRARDLADEADERAVHARNEDAEEGDLVVD